MQYDEFDIIMFSMMGILSLIIFGFIGYEIYKFLDTFNIKDRKVPSTTTHQVYHEAYTTTTVINGQAHTTRHPEKWEVFAVDDSGNEYSCYMNGHQKDSYRDGVKITLNIRLGRFSNKMKCMGIAEWWK